MPTTPSDFRFSPRPNRAHEINWQSWTEPAFERARREDKPILLSISAVWCHWCHVMDETSYSDSTVISAINDRYIPVRVDNDRRPDVNARYNQGGWPTTAFLTPDGTLLAGATYLPPEQMSAALEQIVEFYRSNRERIAERAAEVSQRLHVKNAPSQPGDLSDAIVERVTGALEAIYDDEYGGFGSSQKFPMTDALEFLLQEHRITGNSRQFEMVAKSMIAMSTGGMYDHAEGGFFRYSTTRDWSVPHFEKMTEDHAALLRILASLARTTRNERFRSTLVSALMYVRTVLRDSSTQLFAGSQDADEQYYELPLEERRKLRAPYVDRTSYSNWTAAMAGTFVSAGDVLEDDRIVAEGLATLDALHERMRDDEGLLYHFIEPGGAPQVRGLLTDQAAYFRALLDAHEYTGERRFLERAQGLAAVIEQRFGAPDGGFYDHASVEEPLGNLSLRDRPLADNSLLAECLMRLSILEGEPRYREIAANTLSLYVPTYESSGVFAASYARSVRRFLSPETSVVLLGSAGETAALREAAHALPSPLTAVRTIDVEDGNALLKRGFDFVGAPGRLCLHRHGLRVTGAKHCRTSRGFRAALKRCSELVSPPNQRVPKPNAVDAGRAGVGNECPYPNRKPIARRQAHQRQKQTE